VRRSFDIGMMTRGVVLVVARRDVLCRVQESRRFFSFVYFLVGWGGCADLVFVESCRFFLWIIWQEQEFRCCDSERMTLLPPLGSTKFRLMKVSKLNFTWITFSSTSIFI